MVDIDDDTNFDDVSDENWWYLMIDIDDDINFDDILMIFGWNWWYN